ncbi:hypothetical protein TNCV_4244221 [Trichonephila clavipes]|nr:hypothetical protein TNCV_4244221 [Trichonephila clavipes]
MDGYQGDDPKKYVELFRYDAEDARGKHIRVVRLLYRYMSLKVGSQLFVPLQHLFSNSHLTIDPWYQRLWKSITRIFRFGEKETFTHVDMIECMDGKPLSDKSIQDFLSNNQPSLPEKNLPWPIKEDEESVKDSIDGESAKEEPESVLETCT